MLTEAIQMDLDIVIPSEIRQKMTKHMISLICRILKNGTNELVYKQEESHNVENYLMVQGQEGRDEL